MFDVVRAGAVLNIESAVQLWMCVCVMLMLKKSKNVYK
jgi:hypothetical protein